MNFPNVTVLIVTYNYGQYIGDAIESVCNQTYPQDKVEIVIVDDGSSDNTQALVKKYLEKKSNIKYYYQNNEGKASATKKGIELSTGDYLFNLDADDFYHPNCIEDTIQIYNNYPDVVQVSHVPNRWEVKNNVSIPQLHKHHYVNRSMIGIDLYRKSMFNGVTFCMGSCFSCRMSIIKSSIIMEDIDMYIDYFLFFYTLTRGRVYILNKVLSTFRRHEKAYSEGHIKYESTEIRTLRYLKSARAVYREVKVLFKDETDIVKRTYVDLLEHEISGIKYTRASRIILWIKYMKSILNIFYKYSNPTLYLIRGVKKSFYCFTK
ncbi:hypothetical protein GCM10023189_31900 [Nibrella saemangeumensis]|uniref:Glycosyltransferase 2-like domain-containing protein n=1 Tax=Nibrella saemangeumensis TaxID=1084526 RepID=A0ABP8MZZ7_9BACT